MTLAIYASAPAPADKAAAETVGQQFFGETVKKAKRQNRRRAQSETSTDRGRSRQNRAKNC
jgi:hypothetical protein